MYTERRRVQSSMHGQGRAPAPAFAGERFSAEILPAGAAGQRGGFRYAVRMAAPRSPRNVRQTIGWGLAVVGGLLAVMALFGQMLGRRPVPEVFGATVLPLLLADLGLLFATRRRAAGAGLILAGVVAGYAAVSAALQGGAGASEIIGAAVFPVLFAGLGLYFLGMIRRVK
jgi:hypothetical protein